MELVAPSDPILWDRCELRLGGLQPGQLVTVAVSCDYGRDRAGAGRVYESRAQFEVDSTGGVSVAGSDPVSGSWTGDDTGSGPWWSAQRLDRPSSPAAGEVVPVEVIVTTDDGAESTAWVRHRRAGPVRIVDSDRRPLAMLRCWLPDGTTPTAGLIVIGGSGGGVPADAGYSMLASTGVAVCAVGYFGLPGLPTVLRAIPVEVALSAADALREHGVASGVGLVGTSRGSELALLAAAAFPDRLGGVFAVVPSGVVNAGYGPDGPIAMSAWTLNGEPVPYQRTMPVAPDADAVIPVEKISGPLVTLIGGDDQLWPSALLTAPALERRRGNPHPHDHHLVFDGAGHQFFGSPGIPVLEPARARTHPISGATLQYGGTRQANAMARDRAWTELRAFALALAEQDA